MVDSVSAILLAAGPGSRLGKPKAQLTCPAGRPIIADHVDRLREAGITDIVVVLGAEAAVARAMLTDLPAGVRIIECPTWEAGMGESLRAGLAVVAEGIGGEASDVETGSDTSDSTAALVMLVDLVAIPAQAHARLVAHAAPAVLARCTWGETAGHPTLIGRDHWAAAAELAHGDVGAKELFQKHRNRVVGVECGDLVPFPQLGLFDVDTPADLHMWHGSTPV